MFHSSVLRHSGAYGALWCAIARDAVAGHGVIIDSTIEVGVFVSVGPDGTSEAETISDSLKGRSLYEIER